MYVRDIRSKKLTFTAPSTSWKNDLVMKDRETGTLWSHHSMKAIAGPLLGAELPMHASLLTTWGRWRQLHPDSLILDKSDTWVSGPQQNMWERYFKDSEMNGQLGLGNPDPRLGGKEVVLTVRLGGESTAYPLARLEQNPVVNDVVGGRPLLAVCDRDDRTTAVWSREVDGRVLEFEGPVAGKDGSMGVRDRQTGSLWNAFTGQASGGPLAGRRLQQVPAVTGFWFAWATHYPGTRIWQGKTGGG